MRGMGREPLHPRDVLGQAQGWIGQTINET